MRIEKIKCAKCKKVIAYDSVIYATDDNLMCMECFNKRIMIEGVCI